MLDLVFNLLVAGLDAFVLGRIRKRPEPRTAALAVAAGGACAAFLGLAVGGGGTFVTMRLWAWVIFLHGPLVLGFAAGELRRGRILCAVPAALLVAIAVDAFLVEPTALEVNRFRISSPKLKRPLRIVVFADLQTDRAGDYEREALRRAMEEQPDLLLFAGDYLQTRKGYEVAARIRDWLVELKVDRAYAVRGNVDVSGAWLALFRDTGVRVFESTGSAERDGVVVTGLSLDDAGDAGLRIGPRKEFHVVFGHYPDFALGDVRADLLVAGHTHGGQVRLPGIGPLLTMSRIPRAWAAGLTRLEGGRTLVVSRGVGHERGAAPRLRFLCRPELVVVDVIPE
jgi:hypothetical protein